MGLRRQMKLALAITGIAVLALSVAALPVSKEEHNLDAVRRMVEADPDSFAAALRESSFAALAPRIEPSTAAMSPRADALPVVTAHGMGDSCFNAGFKQLTQGVGTHTLAAILSASQQATHRPRIPTTASSSPWT